MFFWHSLVFLMIQQMLAIWSGSSAFSKSTLNIWKFLVHILLKPCLENFEYYFASVWIKCNCAVVWTFFALPIFGIGMKTDLFQSYVLNIHLSWLNIHVTHIPHICAWKDISLYMLVYIYMLIGEEMKYSHSLLFFLDSSLFCDDS